MRTRAVALRSPSLARSLAALVLVLAACSRGEPPAPAGIDATVAPLPAPAVASSDASTTRDDAHASSDASTPSASSQADAGVDPGTLPQTHDKPKASGAAFDARVAALFEGIVKDDPDVALPAFFPVTAYEQVKAIPSPASDWKHRLVAAYKRDIHALHKRLGDSAERAKFVRADVPDERARWVDPNEETNKLGYYRVYGTRVIYEVDGKERGFDVSSLISWRGEWYVVHLTGFK